MTYSAQDFASAVVDYCNMHDEITAVNKDLKTLRKRKQERGAEIMQYMAQHDIGAAQLPGDDGTLRLYSSERRAPATKGDMLQLLSEEMGDERAAEAMARMTAAREVKTTSTLKRTRPKEDSGSKKKQATVQV